MSMLCYDICMNSFIFKCNQDTPAFGALIDGDASVMEFIRMEYLTKRKNTWREVDKNGKRKDLDKLKDFIAEKKPHVIAVTSESRYVYQSPNHRM